MQNRLSKAIQGAKQFVNPQFNEYEAIVSEIEQEVDLLPDEGTARTVYRDCRIMEHVIRSEIAQMGQCDYSVQMVTILERQEKTTAKVKEYAQKKGWDLSQVEKDLT